MSIFNKVLGSIGIGSAKVDARLEKTTYRAGEVVKGVIVVQGGKIEQEINAIDMAVVVPVEKEIDDKKFTTKEKIITSTVADGFVINPNEVKEIPFSFNLPTQTPITAGATEVWIATDLDISLAMDPKDEDRITVLPTETVEAALKALDNLGFRVRKVKCQINHRISNQFPVQEFEFYPGGEFRSYLDELEVVFLADSKGAEVLLEVDKRPRGLSGILEEALEMDERHVRLRIEGNDVGSLTETFRSLIRRNCR